MYKSILPGSSPAVQAEKWEHEVILQLSGPQTSLTV